MFNNPGIKLSLVIISGLLLSIITASVFRPVADYGDTTVYINYALKISGEAAGQSFLSRAPLYPLLLSGIIRVAGLSSMPQIAVVIQYFMNFLSAMLLAAVFKRVMSLRSALLSAILFYASLSSLFYGYMILTETLTVFLFMADVYILICWIKRRSDFLLLLLGAGVSLLILTRFNTLPLIFTFLLIIIAVPLMREDRVNLLKSGRDLFWFILPLIIILNGYSYLNYRSSSFYGLFPAGGSPYITRNAVIATIDGDETISEQNREVYDLFLEGRKRYYGRKPIERKGSLAVPIGYEITGRLYSGYQIYLESFPGLCEYYGLDPLSAEPYLSEKLKPFYREIISQSGDELWAMRILSLLNSFRSPTGIVIPGKETMNLNILPGWLIIGYKLLVIASSITVFLLSILYVGQKIVTQVAPDPFLLSLILLFLSFYLINFIFGTAGDANRFKYPSDPLMTGLVVYFLNLLNPEHRTLNQKA